MGKYFSDGGDLLGQVQGSEDLFIDEDTGAVLSKARLERELQCTVDFEDPNDDPDHKGR